jgi:hypothetical protein
MLSVKWCTLCFFILFYNRVLTNMESPLPYHCYYGNATFARLDQMKKHSTEIHSHHCLYCDTTFSQFDDLIQHSIENHPYHCYYCKTTFVLFEEVIKHSTENHGSLMLKVKYLELNPSSGHYGYKSHWNKTGSSCCNIIHETGSCHFDMTHFFRPVLTCINN